MELPLHEQDCKWQWERVLVSEFCRVGKSSKLNRKQVFLQHALLLPWIPAWANTVRLIGVIPGLLQKEGIHRAQCAYLQRNSGHIWFRVIFIAYCLDMLLTCRATTWCRYRQFDVFGVRFAAEAETHGLGGGREGSLQTEALGPELWVPDDAL